MDYERANAAEWELPAPGAAGTNKPDSPDVEQQSQQTIENPHPPAGHDHSSHVEFWGGKRRPRQPYINKLHTQDLGCGGPISTKQYLPATERGREAVVARSRRRDDSRFPQPKSQHLPKQIQPERWPKVRPENDLFGKGHQRERKAEAQHLNELTQHNLGEDVFGHKGMYMLPSPDLYDRSFVVDAINGISRHLICNIEIDEKEEVCLVTASDSGVVQTVLKHLRSLVLSSVAKLDDRLQLILVDRPANGVCLEATVVSMHDANEPGDTIAIAGLRKSSTRPEMIACVCPVRPGNTDIEYVRRAQRNWLALQIAIDRTLGRLAYHTGLIRMRFMFGGLVFHRYRWPDRAPTQDTKSFLAGLRQSHTEASLFKLAPAAGLSERVLAAAHDYLLPFASGTVESTCPHLVGHYIWHTPGAPERVFEVVTEPVHSGESGHPSIRSRSFLAPNFPGRVLAMQAVVTQLNGGISCALQIKTDLEQTKAPSSRKTSSQCVVQFESEDNLRAATEGTLMFDPRPTKCTAFRQRAVWRYRVKANDAYIFELVRYDSYRWENSFVRRVPVETRWDAWVYHERWDEQFAENDRMKPGNKAKWSPTTEAFFHGINEADQNISGFRNLMQWIVDFLSAVNGPEAARLVID